MVELVLKTGKTSLAGILHHPKKKTGAKEGEEEDETEDDKEEEDRDTDWYMDIIRASEQDIILSQGWICRPASDALQTYIDQHLRTPIRVTPAACIMEGAMDICIPYGEEIARIVRDYITVPTIYCTIVVPHPGSSLVYIRIALESVSPTKDEIIDIISRACLRAYHDITRVQTELNQYFTLL
jgi:hypothetical protein